MTILSSDIRLLESERMTDTADGGGRRTNRVIPDGVASNIFPKVSRLDSVYGRVNLRKLYGHVNTVNVDMYAGAHLIITDAPDNPRIGILAFASGSDHETRTDARDFVENYVVAGPESRMVVYGRQLKGAAAVLAYQRPEEPLPEVGDVYCLSREDGDLIIAQQYMRVQDVAHEVRTFVDESGAFEARVLTLQIGVALRTEFNGIASPSRISSDRGNTLLRTTTVADAARYFGIQPLSVAATEGDMDVMLSSVYAPIVPTTQREAAVSLAPPGGARAFLDTSVGVIEQGPFLVAMEPVPIRATHHIRPGSLVIETNVGAPSVDDGSGTIVPSATGIGYSGSVDYTGRTITLTPNFSGTATVTIRYTPQAEVTHAAHSKAIPINLATRGTVHALVLNPLPAPGTTTVHYRALGRWYTLRDRGDGELRGDDPAYGTGMVDFVTGSAPVTLGALPDVGSSIIVQWGSPVHYEIWINDAGTKAYQDVQLAHKPVTAGALEFEYLSNGTAYTVEVDAAGVVSGDGVTGSFNHSTGSGRLEFAARLPDFDSTLTATYTSWELDPAESVVTPATISKTQADPNTVGEAVVPGSVSGVVTMGLTPVSAADRPVVGAVDATQIEYSIDASGAMRTLHNVTLHGGRTRVDLPTSTLIGTLNATTGAITYNPSISASGILWMYFGPDSEYWGYRTLDWEPNVTGLTTVYTPALYEVEGGGTVAAGSVARILTAREDALTVVDDVPVRVDLTRTSTSRVVPGSVQFTLAGKTFIERNGTLFVDVQSDGSGTAAGSLDYESGIATPRLWDRGAALGFQIASCLVQLGDWLATDAYFRTAGSPLRPSSTYVQVTADDGALLTATSDQNGNLIGSDMEGVVEQTMGVVSMRFGKWVTAAGNETEFWYDPANVVGLDVWKPRAVQPQTLRYSTVVLTSLPLSADILGLDPVRLPSDGRVPIYRPSDVAVIHHTDSYNAGTPAAGSTINVGRTDLSALWLEDAQRIKLSPALYVTDLDVGTATLDAGASLAGYEAPIAARHRIEEMVQVADVQINGQISLAAPLSRSYPLGSQFSSALLFGDLFARVENVFDQQTWTDEWSDTRIGGQAAAQYNDIDYPIEVLNEGAVNERWRINFTNTTNVQVIGENLGVVAAQAITSDIAVTNPLTGKVYFVLRKEGWGSGWATGVQLRFNTVAAAPGFQLARVILPGATLNGDSFDLALRGDAD